MNTTAATPAGRSSRSRAYIWFGYAISAACLVYVLHGFHVKRAIEELADVSWRWVVLGIAFDIASYVVQALRWKLLLAPFGRVKMRDAMRAVFAGLFANLIFPLRPGELLRSFLVSKAEDIGFVSVVGSVLVERLIDLVVTTAGLGVMLLIVSAPARFRHAASALGIVTLVLLGLFIAMILYIELRFGGDPRRMSGGRRMPGKLMSALIGLHAMGTSPSFYPAVFTSLLMPFCQVLALWALMRSYGWGLPFLAAVVVLLVINLGVSLPNAPANVGSYQFFCVLGLNIFEVEKNTAAGFSFFAFFMLTIPFLFLGFYAVIRSGLSMRSMREQMSRLPSEARATQT
ncbi:MAG TPA: lysylphosphatidylglycerol synthase transmembrane domain-containing protein [Candidatus Acidoferrales bacterium]|nr:lysylphosphatidylglycerol synthase transmembrane domain-containing protein [Candidatus Acidoferrales bacterium]